MDSEPKEGGAKIVALDFWNELYTHKTAATTSQGLLAPLPASYALTEVAKKPKPA